MAFAQAMFGGIRAHCNVEIMTDAVFFAPMTILHIYISRDRRATDLCDYYLGKCPDCKLHNR